MKTLHNEKDIFSTIQLIHLTKYSMAKDIVMIGKTKSKINNLTIKFEHNILIIKHRLKNEITNDK